MIEIWAKVLETKCLQTSYQLPIQQPKTKLKCAEGLKGYKSKTNKVTIKLRLNNELQI